MDRVLRSFAKEEQWFKKFITGASSLWPFAIVNVFINKSDNLLLTLSYYYYIIICIPYLVLEVCKEVTEVRRQAVPALYALLLIFILTRKIYSDTTYLNI